MADWQQQLNTILSDPDAMAQIASLAQSLSGGAESTDAPLNAASTPDDTPREPPPPFDADALKASLGALDPELLRRLLPLLRQMDRPESSETTAFLLALRPFLSEARRGKVERAAQLARLIHLGKAFLISQGQEGASRV